jgi:HEAT repeat protein
MRIAFVLLAVMFATFGFGAEREIDQKMVGCTTLKACLRIIDANIPAEDDGRIFGDEKDIAAHLIRFGEKAKREVLRRATGNHGGWRNLAGDILANWPELEEKDVPLLQEALRLDPGGSSAHALARIGTPEAIKALITDVTLHGSASQSGFALKNLGPEALPYILPALSHERRAQEFVSIIVDMGPPSASAADLWAAIAIDGKRPVSERVAALRGLSGIGQHGRRVGTKLLPLLTDADSRVQQVAFVALRAMKDPAVLEKLVASCPASDEPFGYDLDVACLKEIASYGDEAKPYADRIAERFLKSPNGTDRALGASAVGFIGHDAASSRLIELLEDSDWRVVFASARSLSWLGDTGAVRPLNRVAKSHWLPQVRDAATNAVSALESGTGAKDPAATTLDRFEINALDVPDAAPCASGQWKWDGETFNLGSADETQGSLEASFTQSKKESGRFVGTYGGEWGGALKWIPSGGTEELVYEGGILGLEASSKGVVFISGDVGFYTPYSRRGSANKGLGAICNCPSGYGYAVHATGDAGKWRLSEIARLPRAPDAMTTIGRDRYAALVGGRTVVFSLKGIDGLAACVVKK